MKTYCKPKEVDVESIEFNSPAVYKAFKKKYGRGDFRAYLAKTGLATVDELRVEHETQEYDKTYQAVEAINKRLTENIRNRDLKLSPVRQFQKVEGLNNKVRDICQESPEQQVHEYMLVHALTPLFKAKFLPFQYGSIPGRGPEAGKRKIERILRKQAKGGKVDVIQGDVRKAYPSTTTECVMKLLRRDIHKNKALLWYAEAVMSNYPGGVLLIGGYFSAYAFNYIMSYVLRYMLSTASYRRGKKIRLIHAVVCYADDFTIYGHISQLKRAMKKATEWAYTELGLSIKQAWKLIRLPGFQAENEQKAQRKAGSKKRTPAIDMMGYVVRGTYTIIRKKIFRRMRRQLIRADRELNALGYVPWWRAHKLTAYKGRLKNSNSRIFSARYNAKAVMQEAQDSISWHAKKGANINAAAVYQPA